MEGGIFRGCVITQKLLSDLDLGGRRSRRFIRGPRRSCRRGLAAGGAASEASLPPEASQVVAEGDGLRVIDKKGGTRFRFACNNGNSIGVKTPFCHLWAGCINHSMACLINSSNTPFPTFPKKPFDNSTMACLINLSKAPLAKIPKMAFDGVFDQFT